MRSHRKPLIGNFPVRGFVVYGGWETKRLGDWEIGRHQPLFSPSFLWKEVPRRGGGWPRETLLPHSGKPTPPRFARLPLPEEGARMIFKETLIQSLSFAVRDSRFPPTYAAHFSVFLISLSYRQCPIRPFGAPSPRGEGWRYENTLF